jgi:thioredoxin 1
VFQTLSEASFDARILSMSKPCLVDFWAEWCTPCAAYEPILADIAREYSERFEFARVDLGTEERLAEHCGIMTLPALALVRNGEITRRVFGARPVQVLRNILDEFLSQ